MALEIVASQKRLPIDFVKAYEERVGEVPLSVIRRKTLIVHGMLPFASDCHIFLEEGERMGEHEWRKVIYKPGTGRAVRADEKGFAHFAREYRYAVKPERIAGGRRLSKEYCLIGNALTPQGRPYIKASIRDDHVTRMELGFWREEPVFEVLDGEEKNIVYRTRRTFWQRNGNMSG